MFLKKATLTLTLMALLAFFVLDACAQWSPGGTVVYMGDLNLAGNTGQSESGVYVIGSSGSPGSSGGLGSAGSQLASDVSVNNSSMNDTSLDNSSINNASMNAESVNAASINAASTEEPRTIAVLDLSGYAKDRTNKNLAGYTNIMYPIAGISTASTAGGGGGGGCGCG